MGWESYRPSTYNIETDVEEMNSRISEEGARIAKIRKGIEDMHERKRLKRELDYWGTLDEE